MSERDKTCQWGYDSTHHKWDTECGNAFQFVDPIEDEHDTDYEFCPWCGGVIQFDFSNKDSVKELGAFNRIEVVDTTKVDPRTVHVNWDSDRQVEATAHIQDNGQTLKLMLSEPSDA